MRNWAGGGAAVALLLAGLWSARRPIAADAIDRVLRARGVAARYTVRDVGFRTQRLEQLVVGDPTRPDLTADWAEVSLAPTWSGVRVTGVRASGVRLRGRLVGTRVSWGAIDPLLPASDGKSFALPAIPVDLRDTAIAIASDYGNVAVALQGKGVLSDGFDGHARVIATRLRRGDCAADRVDAAVRVTVSSGAPRLVGPVWTQDARCAGATIATARADVDMRLSRSLLLQTADTRAALREVRYGSVALGSVTGAATVTSVERGFAGDYRLDAPVASVAGVRLENARLVGRYALHDVAEARGTLTGRVRPQGSTMAAAQRSLAVLAGTPLQSLGNALSTAIGRQRSGVALAAEGSVRRDAGFGWAVESVKLQGADGLRANFTMPPRPVGIVPNTAPRQVAVSLSGGGLPALQGRFVEVNAATWRGLMNVAPYAAGGARLALDPVRVVARRDGIFRIESAAAIDGPVGAGRITGLRIPVVLQRSAGGALIVQPGCAPVAFERLVALGVTLAPTRLQLCPSQSGAILGVVNGRTRGGFTTGPVRLSGISGSAPLTLSASRATVDLAGPIRFDDVAVRLGKSDRVTRLDIARIDGTLAGQGRFAGLVGQIGGVPLLADAGAGRWRVGRQGIDVDGSARIADAEANARFTPLAARAVRLTLRGNQIDATATLAEPKTGTTVTQVAIAHDLGSGTGNATLAVDGLVFGKTLQPEALTRLTVGVVANVDGRIDGTGRVAWTPRGVTSSGRFTTNDLDLAAAFGPVDGLRGTVVFDDLLALSTPPGQRVTLRLVNSGVEVRDGVIDYRLLPGQRVAIEAGRWPFAGGALLLDPATLDFGRQAPRTLTFRVVGLDAAKFIEMLKLENIAATGSFDGALPIVFDQSGGRIVGGRLVARGKGTLAYVGDVSNAALGQYGKLAFDALKSIKYDRLTIDLDGALDGEIVSSIKFDGINQAPVASTGTTRKLTGLPFRFNIVVRAPFRGLASTARSLQDPRGLLRPVQPPASATPP